MTTKKTGQQGAVTRSRPLSSPDPCAPAAAQNTWTPRCPSRTACPRRVVTSPSRRRSHIPLPSSRPTAVPCSRPFCHGNWRRHLRESVGVPAAPTLFQLAFSPSRARLITQTRHPRLHLCLPRRPGCPRRARPCRGKVRARCLRERARREKPHGVPSKREREMVGEGREAL